MVQTLERDGWIERPSIGPGDDRRRRPVALTAAGRAVMDEASDVSRRACATCCSGSIRATTGRCSIRSEALGRILQEDVATDRAAATSKASSISQSAGDGGASGDAPSGRIPSSTTPR